MQYRTLGRTGIRVPEIGFGCGNVGGLMVRGTHEAQVSAVRHALALGIDYFDTAAMYGNGLSETHLGDVLAEVGPECQVGTKFRLEPDDMKDIAGGVRHSLKHSLGRLQLESVDLLQLHNNVSNESGTAPWMVSVDQVLGPGGIADALDSLREEGLIRYFGFTGMGETDALHRIIESGRFDTIQAYYNLLNPSAGDTMDEGYANQDYRNLIENAAAGDMGVIVIRVMAGGALGGAEARQGLASQNVGGAMAPGNDYESDERRASQLGFLATRNRTLPQASVRFALDNPNVSTVLVGYSSEAQIDAAVQAASGPPLTQEERAHIQHLWSTDFSASA